MFERTIQCIESGVAGGLHPGAQVYVSRAGKVLLDTALGEASPGVPMTSDTVTAWLSAGKPWTACAVLKLWETGRLDLDAPVSDVIPEFAANGKQAVTTRHVLTHTGGFRGGDKVPEHYDWDAAIERVCAAPLEPDWQPGDTQAYHILGSWFVLGELVRRLDGRAIERFADEEINLPLGLRQTRMARSQAELDEPNLRRATVFLTDAAGPTPHPTLNRDRHWMNPRPGSTMRGPIRDLGRFYELLAGGGELDGVRILKAETVRAMTARQVEGNFDQTFRHKLDWGLGVILNSNRHGRSSVPYGFGFHAGENAFGHGGMQTACGFADPENALIVAWVCNGMPGELRHQLRAREINNAIYRDLGLAS